MSHKISYAARWDAIGMGASLFCAIHCLLLPLLITTLPLLGVELLENQSIEIASLVISLSAGIAALYTGYKRQHRRIWPISVFALGMVAMIAGNLDIIDWHASETTFKLMGVVCILTAHIANWKYRKKCSFHDCTHVSNN